MEFRYYRGKLFQGAIVALVCATANLPAHSQTGSAPKHQEAKRSAFADWFYGQRRYGLGYIPQDALVKAVAQRDAMAAGSRYRPQDVSGTTVTPNQWTGLGPAGINAVAGNQVSGRITSLAIDPTNPSTIYVAAAGGGVWKTSNRGIRWDPLTDNLPSLASGAVAVDPFSGEVWYGTGELNFCHDCYYGAGVYRSADGGANWSRVNPDNFLSSPTSVIAFDPRNRGTLFVGRSTALWKSTDGGLTWRAVLLGVVTDFVFNPADSTVVYAALGNFSGAPENGVYRSTDEGETWTPLSGGLPPQSSMGRIALATSATSPSTLYALISTTTDFNLNGLYRSFDGGNTWSMVASAPSALFMENNGQGQGYYDICVQVDPTDPGTIYLGGIDLWKSADGGASWQDLSEATGLHEDQHEIVFDPAASHTFYVVGDGGVWRSPDGGQTLTSLNATLAITQLQFVGLHPNNPNLAVGGSQDNGVVLYRGGFAWDQDFDGDAGFTFYNSARPLTIFTVASGLSLQRSDDGGKTFHLITAGIDPTDRVQFYPPFTSMPGQPSILYFGTQRVWGSSDQGDHWTPLSRDLTGGGSATISALAIAPSSAQTLYAGTSDGLVQVSPDGGRSWSPTSTLPNRFVTSIAIDPQIPSRAYVGLSGFGSGHVFRTDNRGGRWQDISGNLPDIPVNTILIDALTPNTVYLGTDIGVFVLAPDGSWSPLSQGMPNAIVLGLSQNPATGLLVAATHGRGAFGMARSAPALLAPFLSALVNSGSLLPGPLAPGMSVSLFGSNLASTTASPSIPFPTIILAGTTVTVNGVTAPLFSASPGQLNLQVPYGITGPTAEVTLLGGTGQATVRLVRADANPGIFQNGGDGNITHADGTSVSSLAPARSGEEVVLYATGLGAVDQTVFTGLPSPSSPAAKTLIQPIVRVGGIQATVDFSGLTPGLVGVYQVNFVVPPGLSGKVPVVLDVGGGVTSNIVYMSVNAGS